MRSLAWIDVQALGVSREKHHRYLIMTVRRQFRLYAGTIASARLHRYGRSNRTLAVVRDDAPVRIWNGAEPGRGWRLFAGVSFSPAKRHHSKTRGEHGDAHRIADGADVDARLCDWDKVICPAIRFHVIDHDLLLTQPRRFVAMNGPVVAASLTSDGSHPPARHAPRRTLRVRGRTRVRVRGSGAQAEISVT